MDAPSVDLHHHVGVSPEEVKPVLAVLPKDDLNLWLRQAALAKQAARPSLELARREPSNAEVLERGAQHTHARLAIYCGPLQLRLERPRREQLQTEGPGHGIGHDVGSHTRRVEERPHRARQCDNALPVPRGHLSDSVDPHARKAHAPAVGDREFQFLWLPVRPEAPQPEAEAVRRKPCRREARGNNALHGRPWGAAVDEHSAKRPPPLAAPHHAFDLSIRKARRARLVKSDDPFLLLGVLGHR